MMTSMMYEHNKPDAFIRPTRQIDVGFASKI